MNQLDITALMQIRACLVNIQRDVSLHRPLDWSVKESEYAIALIDALIKDIQKEIKST